MNEKVEQIKRWIEKADHDLGTAIITYKHIPKYKDTIAFHCQQSVEKYLKSYIFNLGIKIKRTHDLVYLLELIDQVEKIDNKWFEKAFELQDYAVEIRYPDTIIELTNDEIDQAIQIAKDFRTMIIEKHNLDIEFEKFE